MTNKESLTDVNVMVNRSGDMVVLKKWFWFFGLMVLFLWVGSVAGYAEVILDFALCKGLDQDGLPLERIEKFSSEDEMVMCWVFLERVETGDLLSWVFTGPEGVTFESNLVVNQAQRYVGAKGELRLTRFSSRIQPGNWQVTFFINNQKSLDLGFEMVGSDILAGQDMEEQLSRTLDLLGEFGYQVHEINLTEGNQSFIRMKASAQDLSQAFWNQLGMGFEALNRLLKDLDWYMVQLVWDQRYILSFQVRALDFEMWRTGLLTKDEFWKNKVIRYIYDLEAKRDVSEVRQFYMDHFGVVY